MAEKIVTVNRKALHDYSIIESLEVGLVLTGTEIKSIRSGKINLRDAYARPENGELWLVGAHIARYEAGNRFNHEPTRPRKLLVHRKELRRLSAEVEQKGLTLVPLRMYFKKGLAKVELGLAKGKRAYDKRQTIAKRDAAREMEQSARRRR
jgi:SsrA-binding protein